MAVFGVSFYAHHCDWVLTTIQKTVQIFPQITRDDMFVIPGPNRIALPFIDCRDTNFPRHSKARNVLVADALSFQKLLQVGLVKFRAKPADGIFSDVKKSPDLCFLESHDDFVK